MAKEPELVEEEDEPAEEECPEVPTGGRSCVDGHFRRHGYIVDGFFRFDLIIRRV